MWSNIKISLPLKLLEIIPLYFLTLALQGKNETNEEWYQPDSRKVNNRHSLTYVEPKFKTIYKHTSLWENSANELTSDTTQAITYPENTKPKSVAKFMTICWPSTPQSFLKLHWDWTGGSLSIFRGALRRNDNKKPQ